MTVIEEDDEVGDVFACDRTAAVWYFQAEVLVFDVGYDVWVRLGDAAELGLPVAVEDNPVDVAAA